MAAGSRAPTVWDGAATNVTPASLLHGLSNATSPPASLLHGSSNATSPPASLLHGLSNATSPIWDKGPSHDVLRLENQQLAYRDFTTAIQVIILVGSLIGNATMLWCACRTSVFKSVTGRFIANLAVSSMAAALVCIPFDVALGGSGPLCCGWLHLPCVCKAVKFLHRLFCSVTMISFSTIALDRYYSVLYPLERKISEARCRDLLIYTWAHATAASLPVLAVTNVTDVYVTSSCSEAPARSLGHVLYVVLYNVSTVLLPLGLVFLLMALIRRALSASQKKKVVIAALRTPQNSVSIPYVSQREAELHAALLAVALAFSACSAPYGALVVYRTLLAESSELPVLLYLTAVWLPKVSLLTNPLLFLTVSRTARHRLLDLLARVHRRYSRRNVVGSGGLASLGTEGRAAMGSGDLGTAGRSGSQLLEMFNIGQQLMFRPREEEEDGEPEPENKTPSLGSGACSEAPEDHQGGGGQGTLGRDAAPKKEPPPPPWQSHREGVTAAQEAPPPASPVHTCAYASSSQVAPATPSDAEDGAQFGFGPFELPPQWLPETRNSKKRLLPPLGDTPEELIQTAQPRARAERRISRNNKVSSIPAVDP